MVSLFAPMVKGSKVVPGDVFSWKGTLCFIEKESALDDDDKDGRVRVISPSLSHG